MSWAPIDETTWEFKLREGVTWHDGEAFNADDVIFSFDRLRAGIEGAPASPAFQLAKGGKNWTKVDDYTVHITTEGPYPTMAEDLAMLPIVAEHASRDKVASVDFNSGAAAIGTGPFMFEEFSPGNRITVKKNPNWWGGDPGWDQVIFRPVGEESARLAALLNGDVDIIDYPPTVDLPMLESNPEFRVSTISSDRLIYMMPAYRHMEPYVTANDGSPMMNPLRDWRVRKALSLAINREAIRDRIMGGASLPTQQHRAAGLLRLRGRASARPLRPRGRQGASRGSRLRRRVPHDDHGPERPLHQRRPDHRGRGPVLDPDRDHHGSRDHAAQHLLLGPDPGRRGQLPGLRLRRSSPCR